jgi:signal transduction histidine kinase
VIVALTIPLAVNLRARTESELKSQALLSAQTIAAGIGKEGLKQGPMLNHQVVAYAIQIHGRVIVMDKTGYVLGDSLGDGVDHQYATTSRPEILIALGLASDPATGQPIPPTPNTAIRHSNTLGVDILVAAAPVLDEGRVVGAVRITKNIQEVYDALRNVTIGIVLIGFVGLLAGMLIAFALANSLARPLTRLAAAAKKVGGGDLSARAGNVGGATEIRDLSNSFDDMAERVERTVRSQREFVANASHQLRTPLTAMKLRLETAASETDDPELERQLEAADHEVDRLAETVNRMLTMAKEVELGEATLVDLRDVADRAVERWHGRAERSDTSVAATGDSGHALANAVDLDQVVDNLIDNGLAYGGGPIELQTGRRGHLVYLAVRDHGPGIAPEDRSRVTERFYRGKGAPSGGSGLGLAIARELVEKWGGSLEVGDADGGGARIELRLRSPADERRDGAPTDPRGSVPMPRPAERERA